MAEPQDPDDEGPPLHRQRVDNPHLECPRASNKEVRNLLAQCWLQGCFVTKTKKGHFHVWPGGRTTHVTVPGSPSDHRSLRNAIGHLRRQGLKIQW